MNTTTDHKAQVRRAAAAERKLAHSSAKDDANSAGRRLRDIFLSADLTKSGDVISGYCPIHSEIDPMPLMGALQADGHRICVPVLQGAGQPLLFREWAQNCEMTDGPFGAAVPAGGDWLQPNILLVPLLAFDRRGFRLGYGGGFYDRTLQRLRAAAEVVAYGVAYAAQELRAVPIEPTDQVLDGVVTEDGLIWPEGEVPA